MLVLVLQVGVGAGPLGLAGRARAAVPPPDLWIGSLQTVDSLNPYIGVNDASYLLYGLIYDYPFAFDQDGNYIPNILTNAVCTDASCMNWTYTVRQGVTWSDSSPLTVDDVAFTFNYDSQNLFHLWAFEPYFNQVVQCTGTNKGHCGAIITGQWQVTVYFQRPFAAGKDLFAPIIQKAQWSGVSPQAAETTFQNANPIGTGAFIADASIYTEWQQQTSANAAFHLYRNTNYHPVGSHAGVVNITDIYLKIYSDINKMTLDLEAGTIQLAAMTTKAILTVKGLPNILTQTPLQAIQEWDEIGISQIDTNAADGRLNPARFDVNVRLAMAHATNKDYIIQAPYHGQGQRGDTLVSPITYPWWYNPVAGGDNLTYDLAQANAILDSHGWTGSWSDGTNTYRSNPNPINVSYQTACYQCMNPPNGTKTIGAGTHLEFTIAVRPTNQFPEETDTANYLADSFRKIGIKLDVKVETTENALSTDVYSGYVDMYIWYWSADPDPNYILSMQSSWTLDGWSDNYWNNATYNYYYIAQMGELNVTKRQQYAQQAQKIEYDSAVYIIYIYPFGQWAMRTDVWQGWGDWTAHPYRQMNAYWGANPLWFDLSCTPTCSNVQPNQPPTAPVISGSQYLSTQTGVNLTFTATSSDAEQADTLNFTWDWGDGNLSTTTTTAANPVSRYGHIWSLLPAESYHNYTVTVRVSDGHSAPVYEQNPVYVNVTRPAANPGTIQGTVRDTSNNPVQGAQVVATPGNIASSSTGSTGTYSLQVPSGTYNLTARAPLYSDQTKTGVTVASGQTATVDFSLIPNVGWITGTVRNRADNSAITDASILTTSSGGAQKAGSTDANGHYNITVEPGTYSVNATANGFYGQAKTGVQVLSGQATDASFSLNAVPTTQAGISPLVIAAVSLLVIIVVAAVVAVLLMRRRKKKEEQEARIDLPPKTP